jgi:hypothetical protein
MAVNVEIFKGEVPRIARRLLGNEMAELANNPRLLSGNLESWKGFDEATTQQIAVDPITIYYQDDQLWLTWGGASAVKLLMHFDNVGSTDFIDVFGHTVIDQSSCGSGFQQENTTVLYGAGSLQGANFNLNLEITDPGTDFNFGTGDFTVECSLQWTNDIHVDIFSFSCYPNPSFSFDFQSGVGFSFVEGAQTVAYTTDNFNVWHAFCFMRKSGTSYVFVDGVVIGSFADTNDYTPTHLPDILSVEYPTFGTFYADELRVSDIAQYPVTGYTPATSAFTDVPGSSSSVVEIDVAKASIAGDDSVRTYFCGLDAPRFTDLGLASGLVDGSGNPVTGSSTIASGALPDGGPFPIYSRKLGVPNPTVAISEPTLVPAAPGANLVTITETFDGAVDWNLVSTPGVGLAQIIGTGGDPGASLNTRAISGNLPYGWKTFAIDNTQDTTVTANFAFQSNAYDAEQDCTLVFLCNLDTTVSGSLVNVQITPSGVAWNFQAINNGAYGSVLSSGTIASGSIPTWQVNADAAFTGPFLPNVFYTAKLTITPQTAGTCQINLVISHGTTTVLSITSGTNVPNSGPGFGFGTTVPGGFSQPYWSEVNFDNVVISGTGPVSSTASDEATTYLYTLVNDLGEESGPCPAMVTADGTGTITRPAGQGVTVSLPGTLAATGVDITYFEGGTSYIPTTQIAPNTGIPSPSMNLYRAVTGSTGSAFLLVVANLAFSGGSATTYTDSIPDSSLSEVLESTNWYPPPTDMLGILALPNEIYAGFTKNQLCLSEQGIPHAWPIVYRLTFDYDIVGIGNIDNTVIACTKKFPWLCSGNTPDAYSQTEASYPYACASKRSIQFLENVGVVFATFEGLIAISGPGSELLLTRDLFSKKEWLALNPASMIATVNDDRYFCFYDATSIGGVKGGFYLDLHPQSPYPGIPSVVSGKISLDFHATCRYNDPLSDILYLVIDAQPTPLGITDQTIVSFDTEPTNPLPYLWHSKQFYVPYPTTFQMARITADSYENTTLNLFADGVQYASIPIASQEEFTIPLQQCLKYFEFELVGTDTITRAQFVEDADEFT